MCSPVRCKTCSKTTWAGCGQHIAQVKAAIRTDRWCPGHPKESDQGWLGRLFRR